MHEKLKLGFVFDTHQHYIRVINLTNMNPLEKRAFINSGQITNMFVDKNNDILYYQQGNFYQKIHVEF